MFVDGTFQYLGWAGQQPELTSMLAAEATMRLVCPTKTLAMHGCRFAYLIAPEQLAGEVGELHGNLHGLSGHSGHVRINLCKPEAVEFLTRYSLHF